MRAAGCFAYRFRHKNNVIPLNLQADRDVRQTVDGLEPDTVAQRTRGCVDFGLWQVERIFAFDVAAAHVVSRRHSDDFQGRFITRASSGSGTFHVASDRHPLPIRAHDPFAPGLEEQLGARRCTRG